MPEGRVMVFWILRLTGKSQLRESLRLDSFERMKHYAFLFDINIIAMVGAAITVCEDWANFPWCLVYEALNE